MKAQQGDGAARAIVGRASVVAAGTAYNQAISFFAGLLVARVIGAADFGIFNLARRLLDVVGILTRMGLDIGLQRHFGEARALSHPEAARYVLRRVRLIAAGIATLPLLALALGAGLMLEENVYTHTGFADVLLVLALALPFTTDLSVLGGAYRGTLHLAPSILVECVLLPTLRLVTICGLFLLGWRLWAVVTGTTVASLVAAAVLAQRARSDFATNVDIGGRYWSDVRKVVGYSVVLTVGVLVATLTSTLDVLVLGRYADAASLGQYSLAKTLLLLMAVFGAAFSQGLGGLVAERSRRNDLDGMVQVMSITARWIALCTLPVFAIFLLWGSELTKFFGPSFAIDQQVVAWLALGQFTFCILGPSGWALSMTGRQVLEVKILSVGLLTAGVLCWLAIPRFGQLGAAAATCAAMIVANLARLIIVRRQIGRYPFGPDVISITACGLGTALLCELVVAALPLPPDWGIAARLVTFLPAYGGVTWTLLLRDTERQGIRDAAGSTAQLLFSRTG